MSAAENGFDMKAFMPASVASDCDVMSELADMPTIAIGARAACAANEEGALIRPCVEDPARLSASSER